MSLSPKSKEGETRGHGDAKSENQYPFAIFAA